LDFFDDHFEQQESSWNLSMCIIFDCSFISIERAESKVSRIQFKPVSLKDYVAWRT